MKKIAFVDIDMCLISNEKSSYNHKLISYLKDNNFDEVWLLTGRTTQDLWCHVLNKENVTDEQWKMQLLRNINIFLGSELGECFKGISTPHDHEKKSRPGEGRSVQDDRGESYDNRESLLLNDTLPLSAHSFGTDEDLIMNLMMSNDTTKSGQIKYLLNHINKDNIPLSIEVFDDKEDNLISIRQTLQKTNYIQHIRLHKTDIDRDIFEIFFQTNTPPIGNRVATSETSRPPMRNDIAVPETSTPPIGNRVATSETSRPPMGNDIAAPETSTLPMGNDIAAPETSTPPMGNETATSETSTPPMGNETATSETSTPPMRNRIAAPEPSTQLMRNRIAAPEPSTQLMRNRITTPETSIPLTKNGTITYKTSIPLMKNKIATYATIAGIAVIASFSSMIAIQRSDTDNVPKK
jgi:hypothetical protein